jgi:hypothetical protein
MGGQLGSSSSCFGYCIAALQGYLARIFLLCQLAPHGCEDSAAIEISAFRRISGEADMCRFPGLKKDSSAKKLPNKILKVHVEKIAKTKTNCGCELHKSAKTQKRLRL